MKRTQNERIAEVLRDGRWHGVEELYDVAGPSARTRINELAKAEPYVRRSRTRYDTDGKPKYTAKDWRYAGRDDEIRRAIDEQTRQHRQTIRDETMHGGDAMMYVVVGKCVYVTCGQLALWSDEHVREVVWERWVGGAL